MNGGWPLLLVVCGGGLGAGLRYLAGMALGGVMTSPWPTLAINLAGSLAIGLLVGSQLGAPWFAAWGKHLLVTGLLGGFTTYSAFALDTVHLLGEGRLLPAIVYAAGTAVGCIAAAGLGLRLAA